MTNRSCRGRTEVLAIADTHLTDRSDRLLDRIGEHLRTADVILHAGDITGRAVLDALAPHVAPGCLHVVRGNNDVGLDELPERTTIDVGGCRLAMVHDSGPASGRARRLRTWFPDADVVVFGHSHLPWYEVHERAGDGHVQHHLNPGSAMVRRRAPTCSVARIVVVDGVVAAVTHVPIGPGTAGVG